MSHDSTSKTIGISLIVTIVSSILVASSVVALRPIQEKNKALEKKRNVLLAAGIDVPKKQVEAEYKKITPAVYDLTTGKITDQIEPASFNLAKILKDKANTVKLTKDQDIAKIKVMPKYQVVYLVKDGENISSVILPIYGKGLWSTLYGFLALEKDLKTVKGITFYEHGETPGLGGEIDNPRWKALWPGKQIYNDSGEVAIEIIKGSVTDMTANKENKVDGLSGATLTSRGVSDLVNFWMKTGYKAVLTEMAATQNQGGNEQ